MIIKGAHFKTMKRKAEDDTRNSKGETFNEWKMKVNAEASKRAGVPIDLWDFSDWDSWTCFEDELDIYGTFEEFALRQNNDARWYKLLGI